ncbi:SDR family NAD(P)-dependent oxidoreductase [Sphingosinithalassobacter portus]|uniref:SDR family NAD(P)-dependent oxidoreductase n=1 Tax=Stakelama portus TaxID=2676234 RepID=UPI000D6E9C4F|nr:SDR family NAD(P)-dependent oxidoreductase [Sphingosinithalassobacter portus]
MDVQQIETARSVEGRSVLITGAASGIGSATARVFASLGARVVLTDRDEAGLRTVAAEIGAERGAAEAFPLDISDPQAIRAVVARAGTANGGIDILVNNAGISAMAPIDSDEYDAHWDRHLAILLTAQQQVIRAALPFLRQSNAARIVNIASTEALGATSGLSAYAAAKAGVVGLTRALAVELGKEAITVNCICPGPIETGMTAAISSDQKATYAARRTALRRYGRPEEIAHMIASIALPGASFLTGAIIPVDGGLTARNG